MLLRAKEWIFLFLVVILGLVVGFNSRYRYVDFSLPKPPPQSVVVVSVHANGHEDAWVQYVEDGLVQIQTVDTKTSIVFRPASKDFQSFRQGWIVPVTFECIKDPKDDCDLERPYKLYVRNVLVEMLLFKKKAVN